MAESSDTYEHICAMIINHGALFKYDNCVGIHRAIKLGVDIKQEPNHYNIQPVKLLECIDDVDGFVSLLSKFKDWYGCSFVDRFQDYCKMHGKFGGMPVDKAIILFLLCNFGLFHYTESRGLIYTGLNEFFSLKRDFSLKGVWSNV